MSQLSDINLSKYRILENEWARRHPIDVHRDDRFEFGEWDILMNLRDLEPTSLLLPTR